MVDCHRVYSMAWDITNMVAEYRYVRMREEAGLPAAAFCLSQFEKNFNATTLKLAELLMASQ